MKRIVDEETLKRALAALLTNAPTWESETVFEAINVEYATAIESLAEALANAPYDDLDRALEPSRAFVRGHDAGWSAAIAHTANRTQWNKGVRDSVDALLAEAGYQPDSSVRHGLGMMNFDTPQTIQPVQQGPVECPTCGEYEPRTGGCGTSSTDKRALCNRDTPPPAQQEPAPVLSAGPVTPEMANWSDADKAKLTSVIAQHMAPQPTTDDHHRHVGDSRFESWYSDELDPIGKDFKDLLREAYEAGMNDRAVDK